MHLAADCKTQLCKRHVLAESGINLIHQRTIAVELFAVLDFHQALANERLQPGRTDIVYLCYLMHDFGIVAQMTE
jgi:hypothetical protein